MLNFLKVYATTPESESQSITNKKSINGVEYFDKVINAAKWSEDNGFEGSLIYSNNSLVDGWSVAQIILAHTKTLTPLVAVNPVYIFPYALAKKIASLSYMFNRRIDINWIAGGFQNELKSLGDNTPHDKRYDRLFDYAQIVTGLLKSKGMFSHEGDFYKVDKIKMKPSIPKAMIPIELMSGTSEAGIATANKLEATKVKYAKPLSEYNGEKPNKNFDLGVRFGIIARETSKEAWEIANNRFPDDSIGEMAHTLASNTSDSKWHEELSKLEVAKEKRVYWLKPFHTYKTFCPYLVGSHQEVAEELAGYVKLGHTRIILDIMPEEADFTNCRHVFETVEEMTKSIVASA